MLEALWAVLIDLFQFIFPIKTVPTKPSISPLVAPTNPVALLTAPKLAVALPSPPHLLASGETAYITKPNTMCFRRPILAFDSRVGSFAFGDRVTVSMVEGQFSYVTAHAVSGWVERNNLSYQKTDVFPTLESGKLYVADDTAVVKIRTWLHDECDGGALYLPLQSVEFILYECLIRGITPPWPKSSPRLPGTWQSLLKGKPRVRISIEPKTGSVMEYYRDDNVGVLAFVEAVHPDESIVIRSVGKEQDGVYLVESLPQRVWRELRPVFISII